MYYKSLERLYLNFISDMAYEELPETRKARDAIDDNLMKKDSSCKEQLEDLICKYGDEKEKQGFMNGFKYAFSLMLESFGDM